MFYNPRLQPLKDSLQTAEDLRRISAVNIANVKKKLNNCGTLKKLFSGSKIYYLYNN